jgi:ribonuclease E
MLDSERNNNETDTDEAAGHAAGTAPAPTVFNGPAEPAAPVVPVVLFQPPQVLFQPPAPAAAPSAGDRDYGDRDYGDSESGGQAEAEPDSSRPARPARRTRGSRAAEAKSDGTRAGDTRAAEPRAASDGADEQPAADADAEGGKPAASRRTRSRSRSRVRDTAADEDLFSVQDDPALADAVVEAADETAPVAAGVTDDADEPAAGRRRRRRNTRTRNRGEAAADDGDDTGSADDTEDGDDEGAESGDSGLTGPRRRRRKRRRGGVDGDPLSPDDPPDTVVHVREPHNPADDVRAIKGSTRLEAKKQRRREGRESGRRRPPVVTESEFLARRESVDRTMLVRQRGDRTQIAVLEDGVLVEHYVNRTTHASYVGNVYLGKVQNVLPSMEAAFVDIGKGRNAVLYAGEVNFDASGLEGQPKRIESALKPGQSIIVQVTKDPVGHKGARLTSQVSLPGRYLVYVPGASMTGISRKLPDTERTRLKQILKKVTPEHAGVIVRTAAEGAAEAELDRDITRLAAQWESIEKKAKTASAPALLHGEPDLTVRVIRDVFNEDFSKLIVSGDEGWEIIDEYVRYVAPHLAERISRWDNPDNGDAADDVFAAYRIDEQLAKALDRKVWLPSGGSLVIDRTEAMTVVDVNTGKFTGQGGNLEETVTRNNLEAAEEIVRQLRLRDVGGIVVIDFIDMVLESNRELVLRRMLECLARDRTKHQVAEVTSLGLVQMTRKRVGAGLLEAFSTQCECCNGRGVIVALDVAPEPAHRASAGAHRPVPTVPSHGPGNGNGNGRGQGNGNGRGQGNGRRGDRREEDQARDVSADTGQADPVAVPAVPADTVQAVTVPAVAGEGSGRRTRRSTSAGTAFATAVLVEDSPELVPVVTTATPAAEPDQADLAAPADAPPARRTRTRAAGSATARVTVTADRPSEAPAAEPAAVTAEPAADTAGQPSADAAAQPAETEPAPEVAALAGPGEPAAVPASVFEPAPADQEAAPSAPDAISAEPAEADSSAAADGDPGAETADGPID